MKIQSIEVDGFGALANLSLADIDGGLSAIYGSNGSGKTTLLHFLRGVFCGYASSRKIGLLPPSGGSVGGGSLRVKWDGDVCRFARVDDPGLTENLRVTLVRNDLETTHPRLNGRGLRTDLIPLLFTVGAADVHAVDTLVRQALRDGIQLEGRRENPERLNKAAAHIHSQRQELVRNGDRGRVADLAEQRQQLQSELHQLTEDLRRRCEQWGEKRHCQPSGDASALHKKLSWLRCELAAAVSDLREAEDRAWMQQPATRSVIRTEASPMPSLSHLQPRRREHIDVQRIYRLKMLDRRIDHARTLLAEAARARLEINLSAARIAGSEDTPPDPFLKQVRESLTSLEVGILELRDDSQGLSRQHEDRNRCVCGQWSQTTSEAVEDLQKRLYQLCEQVSRYELRHKKATFTTAAETIGECELSLLKHLEALRTERRTLLDGSGNLREWKGSVQSNVEHAQCECLEHEPRQGWKLPTPQVDAPRITPRQIVTTISRSINRPSAEELIRLRHRAEQLRGELDSAAESWRHAYQWRPQLELPADICALEGQVDEKRIELNAVEASLAEAQERWRVLSMTGEVIRRVVEKIERDQRPTVIQWASQYMRRLTGGRYTDICVTPDDHTIELIAADGSVRPRANLSRGTLDQLSLSLRLALSRAYASRGVRFPLVLDDVLVDTDHERLLAAVTLLREFAADHEQQIIYLTCQTHLADLFELHGVAVRTLPGSIPRRQRVTSGAESTGLEIRGWVDRHSGSEVKPSERVTVERPDLQPTTSSRETEDSERKSSSDDQTDRNVRLLKPLQRRQPDGPYWLSVDAPTELIPSIGSQMGRRLSGLDVLSVVDLIDLDVDEVSLRLASLQITPQRLRDWQAEAILLCCVPDLVGPDAQLLVVCGIYTAEQLASIDVDRLMQQIAQLTDAQRRHIGQTTRPSREIVQRWILSSRRSRSLSDARRFSRSRGRSGSSQRSSSRSGGRGRRRSTAARGSRSERSSTRRKRRSSIRKSRSESRRDDRNESSRAIITPFISTRQSESETELKFHLSPESLVVDAPSIGPTTAKRLEKIGVITVADLLNRAAADVAKRLKNRRVKEEAVLLWQQQARLMCRIPMLRGHDAQVLVACEITEPERVASMTPAALFSIIGPFVSTKEGQRLLRSSKTPDLEEVTDWINWAQHSRNLRAA